MFRLKNVTISVKNKFILKDFNLDIRPGDKILIAGKSGIGKSTILNLLLGFRKPDSGLIYYKDEEFSKRILTKLRKSVGYVSQDVDIGDGNVLDFIRGIFNYKANQHILFENKKLLELIDFFELEQEILNKDLAEISGGERQRIAILTAILLQREIYLLDEPTSALDKNSKSKVIQYFFDRKDLTVVFVSHDSELQADQNIKIINL